MHTLAHPNSYAAFVYEQNRKFDYIRKLNEILNRYSFNKNYTVDDFHFRKKYITDKHFTGCLSHELSSKMWPPIHEATLCHYTSKSSLLSIEKENALRLYSIEKRISGSELKEFLKAFSYSHPLKTSCNGKENYKNDLAPRLFYVSFTSTSKSHDEERKMIEEFGKVKLHIKIKTNTGCLRRVTYGGQIDKWTKMHKEISDLTHATFGKIFHWADAAQACALHLPSILADEDETRLIIDAAWGFAQKQDAKGRYIEIPLITNKLFSIEVVGQETL